MPISGGLLGTGGLAFDVVVQADLSGTAFGGTPTWTDISRFARLGPSPISINKWRQDQLSDVAPSTMTLVLDNADLPGDATAPNAGRFTPFLTSSPWSPHILPGVRIRVGVIVNAVTYWRFDGYVDVWDASYENGEFGICTVSASDILARLGASDALRTVYVEEVLVDSPIAFYPLTEAAGSSAGGNISSSAQPALRVQQYVAGNATFGGATGIATDGESTLSLNTSLTTAGDDFHGDWLYAQGMKGWPGYPASFALPFSIEAVISVDTSLVNALSRQGAGATSFVAGWVRGLFLVLKWDGTSVRLADPTNFATNIGPALNDGGVHHIAITSDPAGNNALYVDGVSLLSRAGGFDLPHTGSLDAIIGGYAPVIVNAFVAEPTFHRGGIGYIAYYATALSAARILAHYTAAKTAFAGEGTATHISRLLTYRKNLGATLDTGQGTVDAHAFAGSTEQQALLDTGKAEGGLVYADPGSGKIVFLDRTHLRNPPSVLTLDIAAQQTTPDLNVRADRDLLVNDVTISRAGGATQRAANQASKDTYGTKGLSETLIVGSDVDAQNAAGWLLGNGKDARQRTPALSVDLLTEPSLAVAAGVLNLVPLQRVTLANPPTSMSATDVIVQGCTDTIGIDVFQCAFFVSPMPRPTLRFDAAADSFTKLDLGNVFAW